MASTTSNSGGRTLRVLLIPFFATSHIEPFTELAIRLAASRPNAVVRPTIAVTPANVSIVQSVLERRLHGHNPSTIKIVTYPFPMVEGLPKGVENLGKASTPADSLRINLAALSDALMRPAQETLIRALSPDAIFTDMHFIWTSDIAKELGVPCIAFNVMGAFPMLAVRHLIMDNVAVDGNDVATVPRFPVPHIRIPRTELPDILRSRNYDASNMVHSMQADCFGIAINTFSGLEQQYCEMYVREGYVKRAYFLGPLSLQLQPSQAAKGVADSRFIDWLDTKPNHSVVYLSFGTCAHISDAQLDELALGLEATRRSFMWVVRAAEKWAPPKGWEKRVEDRGLIIRVWAPQKAILAHSAVGAFVTQCGWNSVLEAVAAGVPMLTWPKVYEQFITERLITEVLGIGERLWPLGAGLRSENYRKHEVIPVDDVARALNTFMSPGGPGDMARNKVMDLASKSHAAMAEGGSSHRDLHRLVDDLMAARGAKGSRL
ncbi:UDP-glycosyltransferase 73C5 [Triticum urartu]|uniref:Glycosyltransferase n=2 Tax=Triticum urartu TaxID=4572 RepID=M7YBH6_TRIUA|nr:UDP-glycosyltransferase 73C4-like [Triticum urartu]EMS47513.1 UDP-glycosyltransferase 73C5 [Triticum urartu]